MNADGRQGVEPALNESASKARVFRLVSYIFGAVVPGLVLLAFFFFIVVVRAVNNGFGALGLAAAFSLSLPVFSFILAIPLGIVAIVFGIKARSLAKHLSLPTFSYTFAVALGCFNILIPILLAVWLLPSRGLCIEDRNPGNGGCLALPIIPLSWQVSPQYFQQLQTEENTPPQPTNLPNQPIPLSETYTNQNYHFSFSYPANFLISLNGTSSNLKSISVYEASSSGPNSGSLTLFINQPYPQNVSTTASGIDTYAFNANGSLQQEAVNGYVRYSATGTPISIGYDITTLFNDGEGNSYYWKSDTNNFYTNIVGSMKTF
jgi:heme/copper-type cytochrome/quinol oxidase subunit 2